VIVTDVGDQTEPCPHVLVPQEGAKRSTIPGGEETAPGHAPLQHIQTTTVVSDPMNQRRQLDEQINWESARVANGVDAPENALASQGGRNRSSSQRADNHTRDRYGNNDVWHKDPDPPPASPTKAKQRDTGKQPERTEGVGEDHKSTRARSGNDQQRPEMPKTTQKGLSYSDATTAVRGRRGGLRLWGTRGGGLGGMVQGPRAEHTSTSIGAYPLNSAGELHLGHAI